MLRYVLRGIVVAGSLATSPAFSQTPNKAFPDDVRFVLKGEASRGERGGVLHYSPNGRMLLLQARRGWSLREPSDGSEIRRLNVVSRDSIFLGWSPDSKYLAFSDFSRQGGRLVLVDAASGKECWQAEEVFGDEDFFLFTADSRSVAFIKQGYVVQRDTATGKQLQKFRPEDWGVRAFSHDLRRACSLGREMIYLWDVESKKTLWQTPLTTARVYHTYHSDFRFTPHGSRLIASAVWDGSNREPFGKDGTLILDVASGKKVCGVQSASYLILSPNSRYLLVGENVVQWVDVVSGEVKATFMAGASSGFFHPRAVFSPDSRLMTYRPTENEVQLFETATAGFIATYRNRGTSIRHVAFAPDGKTLAICYADSSVVFHDLTGQGKATASLKRSPEELDRMWAELGRGPEPAQRALWQLVRSPKQAVGLIRTRIPPPQKADPAAMANLIGQLDDDRFAVRQLAEKKLAELGLRAVPALRAALKKKSSLESQHRMERLLAALSTLSTKQETRDRRAVAVLESIGDEATALLKEYADGPEEDPLAFEAREALNRLRIKRTK
ncbi:MAG TPA: WD40 repeat domain-containing protein [Gemmataceae bacterium]|nr:WD40 repeat domain-containing protein [Gemmataceae bacterium]